MGAKIRRNLEHGVVAPMTAAVDPKTGEIYALSKVDSAIYRLRVAE